MSKNIFTPGISVYKIGADIVLMGHEGPGHIAIAERKIKSKTTFCLSRKNRQWIIR
ncbi:MAG TPA: hypothetical protein VII44_06445 [Puia sp.]